MNKKSRGLGKGLQALLPSMAQEMEQEGSVVEIALQDIETNKGQPRKTFHEEAIAELAASIEEHGLIQPVVVRPLGQGKYQLVVGERRYRACKKLGLKTIPAVIKEWTDGKTAEVALIENIQREDLSPLEEAMAYKTLMEEHGLTQELLSQRLGKSRSYIANCIRLLQLDVNVQDLIANGSLSPGHGKVLLGLENPELQRELAQRVVEEGLSVRKLEELVQGRKDGQEKTVSPGKRNKSDVKRPFQFDEVENKLQSFFQTKVKLKSNGHKGKIEIEYFNEEELHRILETLMPDFQL